MASCMAWLMSLFTYAPSKPIPVIGSHKGPRITVFKSVGIFRLRRKHQMRELRAKRAIIRSSPSLSSRTFRSTMLSPSTAIGAVTPPSLRHHPAITRLQHYCVRTGVRED
ncbi:hypothetical protein DFH06DRAFT_1142189 [Mycena polygramma]|nr:hypothetical protein DFH06DRAFT_1142189 [Mycena polygramma]